MKHDTDILKRIKSYFMRRKSADEAYVFEREVEKDPFLYEAMEGFEGMLTSDIQQAMDELDDRLDAQSTKFIWTVNWGIAASVLAIFTVGISLYFSVFRNSGEGETSEAQDAKLYQARDSGLMFDTLGTYVFQEGISEMDSIVDAELNENSIAQTNAPISTTPTVDLRNNRRDKAKENADSYSWSSDEENDLASADAVDPTGEAEILEAEADDSFNQTEESIASIPQRAEAKKSITMGAVQAVSVEESVVLEKSEASSSAKPKGGMAAYQSYVKKNLNSSEGMPKGTVVLTFELDRNGNPKKVSVAKSLCTACDAEAIRLVENGPKWEAEDKKATGSVVIQFP